MIKNISSSILAAGLLLGLSGCSNMNAPKPTQDITSSKSVTVNQTYIFNDPLDNSSVDQKEMLSVIAKTMSSSSSFTDKKSVWNGTFNNIKGKTVEPSESKITVTYVNGDNNCHKCVNGESVSKVVFNLPSQITQSKQSTYEFKCNMPTSYNVIPHTDAMGFDHPLLATTSILENDTFKMLNSLNGTPLTIKKSFNFKGEINTKYPDKAVFANFKRILGQYRWNSQDNITEVKKQNTFAFNVNGKEYPLYIEVFPYRDGSKVIYSSALEYTLDSKGGSTLTKKDIDNLHKQIEKITND